MKKIFFENINKILPFKDKIEKALNIKIYFEPDNAVVEGSAIDEEIAERVFEALYLGFNIYEALTLKNEEVMLEKINIKDYVRPSRVITAKARVIGKEGKAKRVISDLTECAVSIKEHYVGIIGRNEDVDIALLAIISLIRGKPHAKVYAYLEKKRVERRLKGEDLGLKTGFIKRKLTKKK